MNEGREANRKLRALVLGDEERVKYHPLSAVKPALAEMLDNDFEVIFTENYRVLESGELAGHDVLVAYTDGWNEPVTDAQAEGLIRYVEGGGGLVVLHTGVSLSAHERLLALIGAQFTGHPPYQWLTFEPVVRGGEDSGRHPVVESVAAFESEDEPYQYAFAEGVDMEVILQYQLEGVTYPAAWIRHVGAGRLVSLMPGHHARSLQPAEVRKLIAAGCVWASGKR